MKSSEAIKRLISAGFVLIRKGRGSHVILNRGIERIVISKGTEELSPGMAGKVRSAIAARKVAR